MDELFFIDIGISIDKLRHIMEGLGLCQFFLNFATEISFAEFGDNICVILGGVNFMEMENVGNIPQRFEDLDLGG